MTGIDAATWGWPGGFEVIAGDIANILRADLPWERFDRSRVLVTGANGMLPSYAALTLLQYRRERPGCGLEVTALVRSRRRTGALYAPFMGEPYFKVMESDVRGPLPDDLRYDYIIHGAGAADPGSFGTAPADVFSTNVFGTHAMLELARRSGAKGVLFLSSGAVYGRMPEGADVVSEDSCGSVDPLDLYSCYAEGKRAGETLCMLWARQYQVPARIVRISHTFGPTMDLERDTRAFSEFVRCVVEKRDIQMKSDGSAVRPFCYITDCVQGMMYALLLGENGQAYNLCGDEYYSIYELARMLCSAFPERGLRVARVQRDRLRPYLETGNQGAVRVDNQKLKALGWRVSTPVEEGFRRTVRSIEAQNAYE